MVLEELDPIRKLRRLGTGRLGSIEFEKQGAWKLATGNCPEKKKQASSDQSVFQFQASSSLQY
ncbi:hypothetical protein V2J09_011456 [Rumex salicifolius]